jgi:hypothetical protein
MNTQQTIKQLGGYGKLQSMISAKDFMKGDDYLQFRFSGSRKMNTAKIELTASDEYKITFYKISGVNVDEIETASAFASNIKQVFENKTGLLLSI